MSQVIGLPVYLPIRVKVATGLIETEAAAKFQKWKLQQAEICAGFGRQKFTPCKGTYTVQDAPKRSYG